MLKICAFCLEIGMVVKCDRNWRLQLLVDTARRTLPQLQLCKTRIRGDIHTDSMVSGGLGKKQDDQQKGLYSLLSAWTGCLKACQGLKSGEELGLQLLSEQVDTLVAEPLKNVKMILDIRSTGHSISRLKEGGKSAGPDALQGEHLKFGGNAVVVWLKVLLNALFGSICPI